MVYLRATQYITAVFTSRLTEAVKTVNNGRSVTALDCQVRYRSRYSSRSWQAHLTTVTSTSLFYHPTTSFLCTPNIAQPISKVNP